MALGTHYDYQRRRMRAVLAVETSSARRTELIVRNPDLELSFDDLFGDVATNFNHALIVRLTCLCNAQHVLAWRKRGEDHTTRTADTSVSFVIDINFCARR